MAAKKGKKVPMPQKRNEQSWGEENPPPVSPGRPPKEKAPPDPAIDPSLPVKLGEARAAMEWTFEAGLPKQAGIRLFVLMLRRSPKEFYAELTRLENARTDPVSAAGSSAPASEERLVDPVSERVIGECEAWLERRRQEAEQKAQAIERGERV